MTVGPKGQTDAPAAASPRGDGHHPPRAPARIAAGRPLAGALAAAALLGGCAALDIDAGVDRASRIAHFATRYDHPVDPQGNLLDRALAGCPDKTVTAETACVRAALDAAHLPARSLMALVPGCRTGQVCHYDHTTRDRLGFVEASATDYVKRWRLDLDFRAPAGDAAQVSVAVTDRDDFDAAPPAPGH